MRPDLPLVLAQVLESDHLEWTLGWSLWPRILALTLGLLVLVLAAINLRALKSKRKRTALIGLRLLTVISVLAVWHQPTWVSESVRPGGRRIAIVVDQSLSMAQKSTTKGPSRWERAVSLAASLSRTQPALLFSLDDHLQALPELNKLTALKPIGQATDLLAGLSALAEAQRQQRLSGVVLISDGLDNAALRARNGTAGAALDTDSAQLVQALHMPIHSFFVADDAPIADVAVATVRCSSFGFTRTAMPVAVDVEISGYAKHSGEFTLKLSDNGHQVAVQKLALDGPQLRTIQMEFSPQHVGAHLLQAAVLPLPDEATTTNNEAWAGLRVVRDRTRVLHLAGHPSWDTRFLRMHLRGNEAVDLVSFYVMIGQGSGVFAAAEDTTLIPFPTREIFEQSLSSFDLVIFQDFPFGPFAVEQYLPQLRAYVLGGGAFLVLGGKQTLSAGGYFGTGIADWLPVRLQPLVADDVGFVDGPLTAKLTPAGLLHPVTLLGSEVEINAAQWAKHTFTGRNTGLQAGEQGSVLLTDDRDHPILAVGEVGEGRSAVLATDSLWQWAFPPGAADNIRDKSRSDYHQLLDQLSAWLLRDPDLDLLRLQAPSEPQAASEPLKIKITGRSPGGKPLANLTLRFDLAPLVQVAAEARTLQPMADTTDVDGQAVLTLPPGAPGAYLLTVEGALDGRVLRATAPVVRLPALLEMSQLQPSDRLLQQLAKASGGQVFNLAVPKGGVPLPQSDPPELAEKTHLDLWSRPEVLIWLVLLLGLEWALRRRWGLA